MLALVVDGGIVSYCTYIFLIPMRMVWMWAASSYSPYWLR